MQPTNATDDGTDTDHCGPYRVAPSDEDGGEGTAPALVEPADTAVALTDAIDTHLEGPPRAEIVLPEPVLQAVEAHADAVDSDPVDVLINYGGLAFDVRTADAGGAQ